MTTRTTTWWIAQALEPCFDSVNTAPWKPGRSKDWQLFQQHLSGAVCKEPSSVNKFEKAEEHGRTQELSWSLLVFRHFRHFRHFRQDNVKTLEERADTERERGSAIRTDSNGFGIWLRNLGRCRRGFHRSGTGGAPDWTRPEKGYIKRCATLKSLYSCLAAPVYLIYLEVQMEDATYTYVYSIHIYLYSDLETLISRFKPWSLKMDSAFAVPLGHRLVRLAKVLLE
jgi:hypothetical protein